MGFLKNKLVLVTVAIIIAGAVWYVMTSNPAEPNVSGTPSAAGTSATVDQGIVPTLLTLRAVKLDGTIFSNPTFLSLKDYSTEIVPEPVGRTNPFAPLNAGPKNQPASPPASATGGQTFTPRAQ